MSARRAAVRSLCALWSAARAAFSARRPQPAAPAPGIVAGMALAVGESRIGSRRRCTPSKDSNAPATAAAGPRRGGRTLPAPGGRANDQARRQQTPRTSLPAPPA